MNDTPTATPTDTHEPLVQSKRPIFSPKRSIRRKIERAIFKDTSSKNYHLQRTVIELRREVNRLEYKVQCFKRHMTNEKYVEVANKAAAEIEAQDLAATQAHDTTTESEVGT